MNKFVSRGVEQILKLIFFHDFSVKVGDAYCIRVRVVFEFLRYIYYTLLIDSSLCDIWTAVEVNIGC